MKMKRSLTVTLEDPLAAFAQGRQTATAEGRVEDSQGKLYAHGTTTCIILGT